MASPAAPAPQPPRAFSFSTHNFQGIFKPARTTTAVHAGVVNRNIHLFFQPPFHFKAFRRLDVLEFIPKRWSIFSRLQLFLNRMAGRQMGKASTFAWDPKSTAFPPSEQSDKRPDVPKPKHPRAIRYNCNRIPLQGKVINRIRVSQSPANGNARRIGKRKPLLFRHPPCFSLQACRGFSCASQLRVFKSSAMQIHLAFVMIQQYYNQIASACAIAIDFH